MFGLFDSDWGFEDGVDDEVSYLTDESIQVSDGTLNHGEDHREVEDV